MITIVLMLKQIVMKNSPHWRCRSVVQRTRSVCSSSAGRDRAGTACRETEVIRCRLWRSPPPGCNQISKYLPSKWLFIKYIISYHHIVQFILNLEKNQGQVKHYVKYIDCGQCLIFYSQTFSRALSNWLNS